MAPLSSDSINSNGPKAGHTNSDTTDPFLIPKYAGSRRISTQYQRRTQIQYIILTISGLGVFYNFTDSRLRVAGLACIFPGAGFLAVGGITGLIGLVLTLAALPLSLFAWFGAGGLAFVIANWVLPGIFAVIVTGERIWESSAPIAVASIAGLVIWGSLESRKQQAELEKRGERINAFLEKEKITLQIDDLNRLNDSNEKRELTEEQMRHFQFVLELLFQEFGDWSNYDRIDQFQTAALRYQLYSMQWTTSFVHKYYMPSFQGYIKTAHERAIEKSLTSDVMGYWKWESLWGKFTLDWDPVKRDNIMVTGYILLCLSLYQKLTGDARYEADGSLNFQITNSASYRHSTRTIFEALMNNWNSCSYTLFPCEPNWIYPICNMQGAEGATAYESIKKTGLVKPFISGRFRRAFEEDFVSPDGRVVPIRSAITGYCIPNLAGVLSDLGSALTAASSAPNLARRIFLAAKENHLKKDKNGKWSIINLVGADQIDPGNYKKGTGLGYAETAALAGELGQKEVHDDMIHRLNSESNPLEPVPWGSGALRNRGLSVLTTSGTVKATLMRRGEWHNLVNCDIDERVMGAPKLTDVPFPDVMVVRCHPGGDGIDFVLRACAAPVVASTIGFKDLQKGVKYKIVVVKGGEERDIVTGILAGGNGCADAQIEVEKRSEFLLRVDA